MPIHKYNYERQPDTTTYKTTIIETFVVTFLLTNCMEQNAW
jgi:hypothetical protein